MKNNDSMFAVILVVQYFLQKYSHAMNKSIGKITISTDSEWDNVRDEKGRILKNPETDRHLTTQVHVAIS